MVLISKGNSVPHMHRLFLRQLGDQPHWTDCLYTCEALEIFIIVCGNLTLANHLTVLNKKVFFHPDSKMTEFILANIQ